MLSYCVIFCIPKKNPLRTAFLLGHTSCQSGIMNLHTSEKQTTIESNFSKTISHIYMLSSTSSHIKMVGQKKLSLRTDSAIPT